MSISNVFVKMHTGDPGSGGTANAAASTTRKALSIADQSAQTTADNTIRLVQDADLVWAGGEVAATESWAWLSYWTAASGGTWLGNEDIVNVAADSGVAETIVAGTLVVTNTYVADWILRTAIVGYRPDDRRSRNWRGALAGILTKVQKAKFSRQSSQQI